MIRLFARRLVLLALTTCASAMAVLPLSSRAAESGGTTRSVAASNDTPIDEQSGDVMAESFHYDQLNYAGRTPSRPNIAPATGWYGYGFPTQTHRWGWFGAERYYPRVVWHRGYYGDCSRWAYRSGY